MASQSSFPAFVEEADCVYRSPNSAARSNAVTTAYTKPSPSRRPPARRFSKTRNSLILEPSECALRFTGAKFEEDRVRAMLWSFSCRTEALFREFRSTDRCLWADACTMGETGTNNGLDRNLATHTVAIAVCRRSMSPAGTIRPEGAWQSRASDVSRTFPSAIRSAVVQEVACRI